MTYNTTIRQGSTWQRLVTMKYKNTGLPVDLTDAVLRSTAKKLPSCLDVDSVEIGFQTVGDPTEGVGLLTITDEQSESMPHNAKYAYDAEVKLPSGVVLCPVEGNIEMKRGITTKES